MPPVDASSSRSGSRGALGAAESSNEVVKDGAGDLTTPLTGKVPYVAARGPAMGDAYTGSFLGDNFAERPLLARLNYVHVVMLGLTPLLAAYGLATARFDARTWAFAVVYYFISGLGITAGYHRLFAHKAYTASWPLRALLVCMGSAAVEGSVRWWSRDHRAHHRYVDTDRDPYAAIKGFWYAHIGWMLVKQDKTRIGKADISDLDRDPMIAFQHRAYPFFALFFGIALPTLVCGLAWNDWYGGYFIAAVARLVFVQHSTFFVNSLAHYAGSATYTDQHSARNSWITALLTLGEGYHNFHHEFPNDFRNGIEWYQYDPTKLFIAGAAALGLAWDLKEFPHNEVAKGQLQMRQKALDGAAAAGAPPAAVARRQRDLDAARAALNWGPAPAALPLWPKADFERRVKEARDRRDAGHADAPVFMILDGFVLDVQPFLRSHPGGQSLLVNELGNDISEKFKGGVYKHSNAAQNMQVMYRVARLQGYWS